MVMAAVSVRNLDAEVKERLRIRAAEHGRSLEAEIRAILAEAVQEHEDHHLGRAMVATFEDVGGVELELPTRADRPRAPDLS